MKITTQEINQNNVKSAPDKLSVEEGYSIRSIKHIFDKLPELIAEKHNKLLEYIQEKGGPVKSEDITDIRMNSDNALEVSSDGENWQLAGNVGHIIEGWDGNAAPQRSRIRFANCTVRDNGEETVVEDAENTVNEGDYGGYINGSYCIPVFNVNRCGRLTYATESVISTATSGSNGLMSSEVYNYITTNGHYATEVLSAQFVARGGSGTIAVAPSTNIRANYH